MNSLKKRDDSEVTLGAKKRRKQYVQRRGPRYYRAGTRGLVALLNEIIEGCSLRAP